jgi:hypothetical protein
MTVMKRGGETLSDTRSKKETGKCAMLLFLLDPMIILVPTILPFTERACPNGTTQATCLFVDIVVVVGWSL